jgi:hypothetical protein
MEQSLNLTIGFKGGQYLNAMPIYNHDGAPYTKGGLIDSANTETAYFGRVVSEDPSNLGRFLMGCADGDTVVGILQNDYAINENSPAKPTYLLSLQPATAIFFGPMWLGEWTHVASGALTTPVIGSLVIFKEDTGQIEFLSAGAASIPTGYKLLNASVKDYAADQNRVLLFMGLSDSQYAHEAMFESDSQHAIDFSNTPISTNTDGSLISTGANWLSFGTAGQTAVKLLTASTAITGDYAALRIRARSDGAFVSGTRGGVIGGNFSASANVNNYLNLFAIQGYAQTNDKTQSDASSILCGLYSCIDNGATNAGRSWSLWVDTHETVKAGAGHYLARMSHNGGAITLDGFFSLYSGQGCSNLFNFENTNAPVESGDATGGTKSYKIAVKINGVDGYLQWYAK